MSLAIPTVIIQDDLGNTMSMTPTQLETGSGLSLQTTPLTFLSNLGYALNALTQPTDPTTCNFQNAIGVQDTSTMPTNSIVKMGGDPATLFGIEYTSATNATFDFKTAGTGAVKFNKTIKCDAGGSTRIEITPTSITQAEPAVGTIPYMPTFVLPAVSNQSIQIPPFTANPHQIALQSAPVPLIDKLEVQSYFITAGETVNCYGSNGTDFYLGCESGNVYWYDVSITEWTLMMTFDDAVRVLYFHPASGRMYIGGKFNNLNFPLSVGSLNRVCYSTSFPSLFNTIAVDIWFNYSVNGFNSPVNAITGDGSWLYFGGEFTNITGGGLNCPYIAVYDYGSTGDIYALDNISGFGFNGNVFGLNLISDRLAITGQFTQLNVSTTYTPNYCCCLTLSGGFSITNVEYLYAITTALTQPIDILNSVQGDGSTFWISTKDTNIASNGVEYMIQAPSSSFSSNGAVGSNAFAVPQTSYNMFDSIGSVGNNDSIYLKGGDIQATIPFTPLFIYWNSTVSRQEFIDMTTGSIYAFSGSPNNTFTLQGGRTLEQQGATYSTGITMTPTGTGYGFSSTLLWNGTYYTTTSLNNSSPF
jgi:hypothetical protein